MSEKKEFAVTQGVMVRDLDAWEKDMRILYQLVLPDLPGRENEQFWDDMCGVGFEAEAFLYNRGDFRQKLAEPSPNIFALPCPDLEGKGYDEKTVAVFLIYHLLLLGPGRIFPLVCYAQADPQLRQEAEHWMFHYRLSHRGVWRSQPWGFIFHSLFELTDGERHMLCWYGPHIRDILQEEEHAPDMFGGPSVLPFGCSCEGCQTAHPETWTEDMTYSLSPWEYEEIKEDLRKMYGGVLPDGVPYRVSSGGLTRQQRYTTPDFKIEATGSADEPLSGGENSTPGATRNRLRTRGNPRPKNKKQRGQKTRATGQQTKYGFIRTRCENGSQLA